MLTLGICIGASSISFVVLEQSEGRIKYRYWANTPHEGKIQEALQSILDRWRSQVDRVAVTGRHLEDRLKMETIAEPVAVEYAYNHVRPRYPGVQAVVSAGSETFVAYRLGEDGLIAGVYTGNRCASGTGEFFLQQVTRMGLTVEAAISLADRKAPLPVATRCSVFCKSDCTHALNKGAEKSQVVGGLCLMMAQKILGLLQQCQAQHCLLAGGVSRITTVVDFLEQSGVKVVVPPEAAYFEALGASLWALENSGEFLPQPAATGFFSSLEHFERLAPLGPSSQRVTFIREMTEGGLSPGEQCVAGIDVGSTTTKAVLVRLKDQAWVGRIYLRTEGDPTGAARRCYQALADQAGGNCQVVGLGVTGSGRQIVGLHALTDVIVNEIIAHATAAAYFDPVVDTIMEIGGQDAKYTLLQNGVPVEYAMNEACSAGTGSFLEEAARESLGLAPTEIQQAAFKAGYAPNFNDQCAAFIGSDIKTAIQAGISREEIAAGLAYAICQNYLTRVKGSRAMGRKIFMQGGVCYNQAIPVAMAGLLEREIVVPPEPGLMGAYGVALEVGKRLATGLIKPQAFSLEDLARREAATERTFTCKGGKEHCDLRCAINLIRIEGSLYPFGGACSKYMGRLRRGTKSSLENPIPIGRQAFWHLPEAPPTPGPKVGLNRSLLGHALFPLYSTFFSRLGCQVVAPSTPLPEAKDRMAANFCNPVELSHTYLAALQALKPDWIFLPHITGLPAPVQDSSTCPIAQAEPYYLHAAFPEWPRERLLSPVLNLSNGLEQATGEFVAIGKQLGFPSGQALSAYRAAVAAQETHRENEKQQGLRLLRQLEADPGQFAVVIFGRPYNALAPEANLAIPQKYTSRGIRVIPHQWLPCQQQPVPEGMYWSLGQAILQAAHFTSRHPQLFGCYITNFSCGPDSFLVNYFREIMGSKPALVLELDHHTADAGLDTRMEAFLDIVASYLQNKREQPGPRANYSPALTLWQGNNFRVRDSRGSSYSLTDYKVKLVVPAMGLFGNQVLAATFRHQGINALALDPPSHQDLQMGKGCTSCKECLPLQLTAGSLLSYLARRNDPEEVTVYFMPKTSGPCRFGQYHELLKQIIRQREIPNVAFMSLSSANSYAGLPTATVARAWQAVVVADVLEDIYYTLMARAADQSQARLVHQRAVAAVLATLEKGTWKELLKSLHHGVSLLRQVPLRPASPVPRVLLTGEIYVRKDPLAQQHLADRLAQAGIAVTIAPIGEWLDYCDFLYLQERLPVRKRLKLRLEKAFKAFLERQIKGVLASSGLYQQQFYQARLLVEAAGSLLSPALRGEAVLTVGGAIAEADHLDGVAIVGPFGCMPHRIAEAILTPTLRRSQNALPFLAVESDGGSFPRAVETRLEAFISHVHRRARKKAIETPFGLEPPF